MSFCSAFQPMYDAVIRTSGFVSVMLGMAIALMYMIGEGISNPRLIAQSKEEFIQLLISFMFLSLSLILIKTMCSVDYCSIYALFSGSSSQTCGSIYDGAVSYLSSVASYAHNVTVGARYYIGKSEVAQTYSKWKCPLFLCIFSGGGTGENDMPYAGAGYFISVFTMVMQSGLFAFFNAMLNLQFISSLSSGFFLMLFPFAVFFRAMPFMRKAGAVIMAIVFSFFVVYPLLLSVFGLAFSMPSYPMPDESKLKPSGGFWGWLSGSVDIANLDVGEIISLFSTVGAMMFYCVFLPNLALVSSIGTTAYITSLLGEEVDLAHLFRMM